MYVLLDRCADPHAAQISTSWTQAVPQRHAAVLLRCLSKASSLAVGQHTNPPTELSRQTIWPILTCSFCCFARRDAFALGRYSGPFGPPARATRSIAPRGGASWQTCPSMSRTTVTTNPAKHSISFEQQTSGNRACFVCHGRRCIVSARRPRPGDPHRMHQQHKQRQPRGTHGPDMSDGVAT